MKQFLILAVVFAVATAKLVDDHSKKDWNLDEDLLSKPIENNDPRLLPFRPIQNLINKIRAKKTTLSPIATKLQQLKSSFTTIGMNLNTLQMENDNLIKIFSQTIQPAQVPSIQSQITTMQTLINNLTKILTANLATVKLLS